MTPVQIKQSTLDFLSALARNNNREWFELNRDQYHKAHDNMLAFTDGLTDLMQEIDNIVYRSPKQTLLRIYRDIRFSKDKTPYKTGFAGSLKRDTPYLRGGYFYRVQPNGESIVMGGFWRPNTDDITRVRKELEVDSSPMRSILNSQHFKNMFGELIGEEVKSAPRGFSRDHPDIDLIRKKQFLVKRTFSDKQVMSADFTSEVATTFAAMRPFFDYMSDVLTTDENGVPII